MFGPADIEEGVEALVARIAGPGVGLPQPAVDYLVTIVNVVMSDAMVIVKGGLPPALDLQERAKEHMGDALGRFASAEMTKAVALLREGAVDASSSSSVQQVVPPALVQRTVDAAVTGPFGEAEATAVSACVEYMLCEVVELGNVVRKSPVLSAGNLRAAVVGDEDLSDYFAGRLDGVSSAVAPEGRQWSIHPPRTSRQWSKGSAQTNGSVEVVPPASTVPGGA